MIAGWLALMLVAADTTVRFPSIEPESLQVRTPPSVSAETIAVRLEAISRVALDTSRPESIVERSSLFADTTVKKKRPKLVSYSDWYGRRLAIHRTLTWTMIPLFAVSYYTGERLARDGRVNSPYAIRALHPYAATGATVVFGVNTFTGVWNLWDARHDPEGRKRRYVHSVLFMIADAGFAYGGSIGNKARSDGEVRSLHRTIALSSMGVSYLSMMLMLLGGK
jgi:hypothetical protein